MTDITYRLPILDTLNTAWDKVKGVKGTFWAVMGIVIALEFVIGIFTGLFQGPHGQLPIALGLLTFVVGLIVLMIAWGMLYFGIQRAADQPIQFSMISYVFNTSLFFRMIGVYILQMLILAGVSALLGVAFVVTHFLPGGGAVVVGILVYIVWLIVFVHVIFRMYLSKAFVIARHMGPLTAIYASFAATKGNVWRLVGVAFCSVLVFFVSAIPLGIGLIWSLPFLFINYGEVFKRLTSGSGR
jgi:hypothetical protein